MEDAILLANRRAAFFVGNQLHGARGTWGLCQLPERVTVFSCLGAEDFNTSAKSTFLSLFARGLF